MENLQTIFKPKHENIALYNAFLTNSYTHRDEKGDFVLFRQSEINERIAQLYEKKDFIHAAELLESVKKLPKGQNIEVSAVVSKSIRLGTINYLKIHEVARKKKMCLSDVIRTTSIPKMKKKLDECKDEPTVEQEKLGIMYDLLKSWEDKMPTSPDKEYLPRYNYTVTDEIEKLFSELIKYSILDDCKEEGIPIEDVRDFISNLCIDWERQEIFPEVSLSFDSYSNLFKLDIEWINLEVIFSGYNAFKENIANNLHKKLDNAFEFDGNYNYYAEDTDNLFYHPYIFNVSSTLQIENDKLFFDGVDVIQRDALNALIYEKITKKKYADFAVEECMKQVQDALAKNDYDTAAQLNERLARFQVYSKISSWYGDIMASMANESNVVTFTIPKLLLLLWEAAKGDKSIQTFVNENLQEV